VHHADGPALRVIRMAGSLGLMRRMPRWLIEQKQTFTLNRSDI